MAEDRSGASRPEEQGARRWIARTFTHVEDAVTRRILVLTAEFKVIDRGGPVFRDAMLEIGGGFGRGATPPPRVKPARRGGAPRRS